MATAIDLPGSPLQLGFVPVSDAAPLIMARELGLFGKYGVRVDLRKQIGWANVRDKLVCGQLHAAHAPGALPIAIQRGFGCPPAECHVPLFLNMQGNAITISRELWLSGLRTPRAIAREIQRTRGKRLLTFGVVFSWSAQNFILRKWLRSGGINPDRDVRIVVIPPAQMFPNLRLGNLDGFCVGEPWTSVAIESGSGFCAATSAELAPWHPEKALIALKETAEQRRGDLLRLTAALLESCAYCDLPENRREISAVLSRPEYINAPVECVEVSLSGNRSLLSRLNDLNIFYRHHANEPTPQKAAWILDGMESSGAPPLSGPQRHQLIESIFRLDAFDDAQLLVRRQAILISHEPQKNENTSLAPIPGQ